MKKSINKDIQSTKEEITNKIENLKTKQDAKITKPTNKVKELERNIEINKKENDEKLEAAIEKVDGKVDEVKSEANEKILEISPCIFYL